MAIILYLETATKVCSVALADGEQLLALHETSISNSHSELITVFIQEVIEEAGIAMSAVDAVAVSMGPGSYTGLRIGVSTAKGLCYGLGKPLISVGTLQAMAFGAVSQLKDIDKNSLICPMLDARRMEVYYSLYDRDLNEIQPAQAAIITAETFQDIADKHSVLLMGDGAEKCMPLFEGQPNIKLLEDFTISARYMMKAATQKFHDNTFEDVAYFEPFYLKDFIAGKPVVKGLHK
jgi:tRNA threonylcarbamoyladenosine biosynthesis protein TsaB